MKFLNPEFLYFMLPPLAFFAYFILQGGASYEKLFAKEVLDKILIKGDQLGSRGRNILFLLAFIFFIFALARPISNQSEVTIENSSKNLVIAIDISRSMTVDDIYPTRLEFVKNRLKWFINELPNTNIGIIAFAKDAFLVSPVTNDKNALEFLLNALNSDIVSRQGTNITNALRQIDAMFPKKGIKDVLLISDGGESKDIQKAIKEAQKDSLHVNVMVVGTKKGGTIKTKNGLLKDKNGNIVISKRNDNLLKLSEKTKGIYIKEFGEGGGVNLLKKALQSQKNDKNKTIVKTQKEWFMLPLGIGFFLVLIALHGLPRKRFLTLMLPFLFVIPSHAGIFDFMTLKNADKALKNQEYQKAIDEYNKLEENPQINYNKAGAYYKMKKYDEALKEYEKIETDDKNLKAKTLFNKGNTHVQKKELKKALKSYEEAKKLTPKDEDIDKNIEYVKKLMKKNQQQQKQNQKNNKKKKQNNKKKNDKKNSENQLNSKNDKKQKDDKNGNDKQKGNKEKNQDQQKSDQHSKGKDKQKSEQTKQQKIQKQKDIEGEKWEKILKSMHPRTNPVKLGEMKDEGEEDGITW